MQIRWGAHNETLSTQAALEPKWLRSFVLVANIGFDTAENKAFKVSRKLLPSSYRGREKRSGGQERLHERLPVAMEAQHCRELVGVEVVQPGRA